MKIILLYSLLIIHVIPVHTTGERKTQRQNTKQDSNISPTKSHNGKKKFTATWTSLDSRSLPEWYDEAKFGIFVHWGVYSVPGMFSEWFWFRWKRKWDKPVNFMKRNYPPGFEYADFGSQFKAELFNATQWADLVARSGAKYFVFTSKHHEGFANWDTSYSWNWNSVSIGPHRDIVDSVSERDEYRILSIPGELATAFRKNHKDITFGLYFSLYEWFNPLYLKDKANNFTTQEFVKTTVMPQLRELIQLYKPEYLWTDGDWEAPEEYWDSKNFLAWLYNDSPVSSSVVVNNRWGNDCACLHGEVHVREDRYNLGRLGKRKWENAVTLLKNSWGIRRDSQIDEYLTVNEMLRAVDSTVSCGGNVLMNISPASDGTIPVIFQERLQQMGDWLLVNGEAIYGSKPWKAQKDTRNPNVWYTTRGGNVYAITLEWPSSDTLVLDAPIPSQNTQVTMLGLKSRQFNWEMVYEPTNTTLKKEILDETEKDSKDHRKQSFSISVPPIAISEMPSLWAWVFKLTIVN